MAATAAQQKKFIEDIAPLIIKYAKANGYKVASAIIAQACIESNYGISKLGSQYHNYFGMKCGSNWKGPSVNLATKEEYTAGTLVNIKANFRVYSNMEEGVKGYFEFISKSRYANLKNATTPKDYLTKIKADGYATSSTYITTNMNVVNKKNLTQYDPFVWVNLYYNKYTGISNKIDTVLKAIGVPSAKYGSVTKRKPIAVANGLKDYSGKADENVFLIKLAKNGKLKKG